MMGEPCVHGSPFLVSTAACRDRCPLACGSMVLYFLLCIFPPGGRIDTPAVKTIREQMINLLATTAAAWGYPLSPAQLDQFDVYAAELRRWNERVNLTAIAD